jgi:hypothetical protein
VLCKFITVELSLILFILVSCSPTNTSTETKCMAQIRTYTNGSFGSWSEWEKTSNCNCNGLLSDDLIRTVTEYSPFSSTPSYQLQYHWVNYQNFNNSPPNKPTHIMPSNGSENNLTPIVLSWKGSDHNNGAVFLT